MNHRALPNATAGPVDVDHQRRTQLVLAAIIAVAVVLRVASALCQGDVAQPLPGIFDQVSYDALARRVLEGQGLSFATQWWPLTRGGEPTAHWSYLYTGFLALVYSLVGPHALAARLIQAVLVGFLQPWLTFRIGRRVFGDAVGLAAAAVSAVYVYFFYYGGALMTEPFYIVTILWSLDAAMRLAARPGQPSTWAWIELGLALGLTVLLRQLFAFFVPIVLLWLWFAAGQVRTRRVRSEVAGYALSLAVIALLILPWTARNYLAFGRFVPLNTNTGYAFFWANHPVHGSSFLAILPESGPSYQDLVPPELRLLDEAALDQALLREGLRFVVQNPGRYLLLSLSRIKDYFMFWPSADSGLMSNIARVASFGLFLPFMVYGLFRSRSRVLPGRQPELILLLVFAATYTLIHLMSWALIRYRLPVDAVLVIFAGLGLVDLYQRATHSHPGALETIHGSG